jgi:hypothetical protein
MEWNPAHLPSLVDEFEGPTLVLWEFDLAQGDLVNGTIETIQIPDFELGIAELHVVPDASQKFVDGRHAPQPAARIGSAPARIHCANERFDG